MVALAGAKNKALHELRSPKAAITTLTLMSFYSAYSGSAEVKRANQTMLGGNEIYSTAVLLNRALLDVEAALIADV